MTARNTAGHALQEKI